MRLVHLSDLHLGFRQYQRLTPGGINQREDDVNRTLTRTLDQVIACAPDVVVIGGDVFHTVRPSNAAILHAYREFQRLRSALPSCEVVMVAGNHDAPRTADTGCILALFREIGVHVAEARAECFAFPERDLVVMAVPDVPGLQRPPLVPPEGFTHRVLLLHGEIAGLLPPQAAGEDRAAVEIPLEDLHTSAWSYIALGHYHVCREMAANAWYSGSIDYTSSNPWGELREERSTGVNGKGFIERDLASGTQRFHAISASRLLVDLEPVDASGMGASDVDKAVAARVNTVPGGIADKVVRVVVRNVARHVVRELDHAALRDYRRQALHFQLDTRRPDPLPSGNGTGGAGPRARRATLTDIVLGKLRERPLSAGVEREALVSLATKYLKQAEDAAAAALPVVDG